MDKTGSVKKEAEFSFLDTTGHYARTNDKIEISYSGWINYYFLVIYKNGKFDYEETLFNSYSDKEIKKGLKNTLIDKYNYNSIKDFVENGNHSSRKVLDYLYRVVIDFSKVAHNND